MKQRSILWQAAGFALVTFGGTILHFLYDWTGGSILVTPFSGVNESTWEHMKLLFWPLFLFSVIQRLFSKEQENYTISQAEMRDGFTMDLPDYPAHYTVYANFYDADGALYEAEFWFNIGEVGSE